MRLCRVGTQAAALVRRRLGEFIAACTVLSLAVVVAVLLLAPALSTASSLTARATAMRQRRRQRLTSMTSTTDLMAAVDADGGSTPSGRASSAVAGLQQHDAQAVTPREESEAEVELAEAPGRRLLAERTGSSSLRACGGAPDP